MMILSLKQLHWRDYLELTKPKVVALMMLTAVVGMYLATPGWVPVDVLLLGSFALSLGMGGAAAINHIVDQKVDSQMRRTEHRPVAAGRVNNLQALLFAGLLCILSVWLLDTFINRTTALLTLLGVIGYAVLYTMYLKRATPQNIVIGGLAGAIPPLLGWTSVTGSIHPHALLLVLIIFVWTPPHFWALAIHRREEYAKVNIPMLPVTHGVEFTKTCVLLYTLLMVAVTTLPFTTGMSGWFYLAGASLLNIIALYYAIVLKWRAVQNTAIKTFKYSIVYLLLLFICLLVDHHLP